MEEKKYIRIRLVTVIIAILAIVEIIVFVNKFVKSNHQNGNNLNVAANAESGESGENGKSGQSVQNGQNNQNQGQSANSDDSFILYKGFEIEKKTGIQYLKYMENTTANKKKYNTTYYNYENGKYVGTSVGILSEEVYEGVSTVEKVKTIATSKKYDAVPRTYTILEELPGELSKLARATKAEVMEIDLDGDGKMEHIVCYAVDYTKTENATDTGAGANSKVEVASRVELYDSDYKKIADLVTIKDDNIDGTKVSLNINGVKCVDIDQDGIMEVIIDIPMWEGERISIVKYKDGNVEGETNIQASVQP